MPEWLRHLLHIAPTTTPGLTNEIAEAQERNRLAAERLRDALCHDPVAITVSKVVEGVSR